MNCEEGNASAAVWTIGVPLESVRRFSSSKRASILYWRLRCPGRPISCSKFDLQPISTLCTFYVNKIGFNWMNEIATSLSISIYSIGVLYIDPTTKTHRIQKLMQRCRQRSQQKCWKIKMIFICFRLLPATWKHEECIQQSFFTLFFPICSCTEKFEKETGGERAKKCFK